MAAKENFIAGPATAKRAFGVHYTAIGSSVEWWVNPAKHACHNNAERILNIGLITDQPIGEVYPGHEAQTVMKKSSVSALLLLVALTFLTVASAFAQQTLGGITGTVTDKTGSVLPD